MKRFKTSRTALPLLAALFWPPSGYGAVRLGTREL